MADLLEFDSRNISKWLMWNLFSDYMLYISQQGTLARGRGTERHSKIARGNETIAIA